MRKLFALFGILLLTGCTMPPSMYDSTAYQKRAWATKSFAEVSALCKHDAMRRDVFEDEYHIREPVFKTCMDQYGYQYHGQWKWMNFGETKPVQAAPVAQPTPLISNEKTTTEEVVTTSKPVDKSALYR